MWESEDKGMLHSTPCNIAHVASAAQVSTKAEPKAARGLGIAGAKRTSANSANGARPVQAQSMPLVNVPHSSSEDQ